MICPLIQKKSTIYSDRQALRRPSSSHHIRWIVTMSWRSWTLKTKEDYASRTHGFPKQCSWKHCYGRPPNSQSFVTIHVVLTVNAGRRNSLKNITFTSKKITSIIFTFDVHTLVLLFKLVSENHRYWHNLGVATRNIWTILGYQKWYSKEKVNPSWKRSQNVNFY